MHSHTSLDSAVNILETWQQGFDHFIIRLVYCLGM